MTKSKLQQHDIIQSQWRRQKNFKEGRTINFVSQGCSTLLFFQHFKGKMNFSQARGGTRVFAIAGLCLWSANSPTESMIKHFGLSL